MTASRLYYQVNYTLCTLMVKKVISMQYRRSKKSQGDFSALTILDSVKKEKDYIGTCYGPGIFLLTTGWWVKVKLNSFMDGDKDFATIVGTGTESYFMRVLQF